VKDTRKGPWVTILLTALLVAGSPLLMGQDLTTREEAMKAFAQLLKISPDPPDVKVNVRRIEERDGLRIEDISWTSLDGEEPLAYVLRPAFAPDRLPAIICLHGSSGSRDSMVTEKFGHGKWIRYGKETPHERLLGWARELARQGYLILALTQRGLDRRTPDTNDQSKEMLLRGRTLMGAIVFEIRQALTYLQERPDVDPGQIGVTGMSFGGITTFYSWLVDDRIAAAASICGGVGSLEEFVATGSRSYHGI